MTGSPPRSVDFRTEYARHPDDPSCQRLIDQLTRRSEKLRDWWAEHAVQPPAPAVSGLPSWQQYHRHLLNARMYGSPGGPGSQPSGGSWRRR